MTAATAAYTDPAHLYHRNTDDGVAHATIFNAVLEKYLGKANNFALEVLGEKREPIFGMSDKRPAKCFKICKSVDFSFVSVWGNVGGGGGYYGRDSKEARRADTARSLCFLGSMIMIISSTVLGYCYGNYLNTQDEIKEKNAFEKYLNNFNIDPQAPQSDHVNAIKRVFRNYSELLAERLERDKTNSFTACALLVSGGVLGLGGALGASGMMVVGGAMLVATLSATGFRLMFEYEIVSKTEELAKNINLQYTNLKRLTQV